MRKIILYADVFNISSAISETPIVSDELLEAQKLFCDYIMNPLIINGTHVGCDAVHDVHHGLQNFTEPEILSR